MELLEKIETILYKEGINSVQFLQKTGFSKGMFYAIKNREKTKLSPLQVKTITDAFPAYDYDYFFAPPNKLGAMKEKGTLEQVIDNSIHAAIDPNFNHLKEELQEMKAYIIEMRGLMIINEGIRKDEEILALKEKLANLNQKK